MEGLVHVQRWVLGTCFYIGNLEKYIMKEISLQEIYLEKYIMKEISIS